MTRPRGAPGAGTAADAMSSGEVAGHYRDGDYTVVWVQGEIDVATAPDLTRELAAAVDATHHRVIVDLTHVRFMDSTGLNALASARRRARATNGEVRLVGVGGMVARLLRITGLEQVFAIHPTVAESMAGPADS